MAIIGYNTIGGATDLAGSNWQPEAVVGASQRYVGVTGDTVTEVAVYGAGTGTVQVGIYVFSGGVPTTRVGAAITVTIGATAGWYTAAASIALTNGVDYCVALDPYEDESWTYHYDPGVGNYSLHNAGNPISLPATWTQGSGGGGSASVYATVTPAGGGETVPAAIADLSGTAGDAQVALTYSAPADGGSAITDYVAEYRTDTYTPSAYGTATSEIGTSLGSANAQPLPASAAAGDLLIYAVVNDNPSTTAITGSTGWTVLNAVTQGANVLKSALICRVLDGTTGNNILSVTGAAQDYAIGCIRVPSGTHACTNANLTTALKIASASGASGNADPPNLDSGDTKSKLWITVGCVDTTTASTLTTSPADYIERVNVKSASSTSSCICAMSTKDANTNQTENPGAYTNSSRNWIAYTIAVPSLDSTWTSFSDGTSTSTTLTVTGLTNSTAYLFRTAAVNAIGQAAWSNIAGPYTPTASATVPAAISDLAGTPGNALVNLTHTAPSDGGSAITDYVYEHRLSGTAPPSGLRYPVSVSGRKILDQNGYVFLMRTMAAWSMAQNLSNAQITSELEKIVARGFNAITVHIGGGYDLTGSWAHVYENSSASPFWTGTPWASSLGAGWSTVDHIASETERLGLVFNMSFPGAFGTTGAGDDWEAVTNTNMYNAGVAIATRYLAYEHIIWHIMLDSSVTPGSTQGTRIQNLFDGINDTEGPTLRPVRWMEVANGSSTQDQGWLANGFFNATIDCEYIYAGNSAEIMEGIYAQSSGPVGDCEPPYVGAPHYSGVEAQQLRERTWAVFLEGGILAQFGHEDYWPFGQTGIYTAGLTWDNVMTHQRLIDQSYIFSVIDVYCQDATWAPSSTFVTTGAGTGDTKAAVGASDTAAIAYFPSSRTIEVDTTILAGTGNVRLRWYNPTDGTYTTPSITDSEAQQTARSVSYPGTGTDWVLVLDLADGSSGSSPGPWVPFSDGTSTSLTASITGLTNGISYDFHAAAVNAIGQAAWSNIAGPYIPLLLERMKRWNGSAWVPIVMKQGAAWDVVVTKTLS